MTLHTGLIKKKKKKAFPERHNEKRNSSIATRSPVQLETGGPLTHCLTSDCVTGSVGVGAHCLGEAVATQSLLGQQGSQLSR